MYVARIFFCEEIEDNTVDDEIDELFSKLEQIEPPLSLIEDILVIVAQLPPPQFLNPMDEEEIVLNEPGIIINFPSSTRLS